MSAAFLMLGIRAIGSASPTTDEPGHYRYGHRILRGVAERWDDSKMPASALNALPCWVNEKRGSLTRDADEFSGPCDWTAARAPTLFAGLVLGLVIAAWSRALFGWSGALVSFGLFVFDPNFLAHSSLITTDVFGALGILLALWAFSSWLKHGNTEHSILAGLAIGAAFIAKYTAAYLLVVFLVAGALSLLRGATERRSALTRGIAIVLIAIVALVVINVGFLGDGTGTSLRDQKFASPQFRELRKIPVLSTLPLPVPRPFVEGLDRVFHRERNGGGSGNIYFLGELRDPGSHGFAGYFALLTIVKTPLGAVVLLFLGGTLILRMRGPDWNADVITLATAAVVFALYFSLIFRAQIGFRYFLVAMPPLFVLAGAAGPFLAKTRSRALFGAVLIAASAASVIRHGDDPLSYFNELVPPTRAYEIAADSNLDWGQSRTRVQAYLAANPRVLQAPGKPFPGRIIVDANLLTGVVTRKRMEWLRESSLKPIGHVAFTHFLFDVTPEQADRLRAQRGDPPLSRD